MAINRPEDLEALASASGVPKAALRTTMHLRRYMPLYAFGTIWALMVVLLPTVHHSATTNNGSTVTGTAQGAEQAPTGGNQTAAGPTDTAAAGGPAHRHPAGGRVQGVPSLLQQELRALRPPGEGRRLHRPGQRHRRGPEQGPGSSVRRRQRSVDQRARPRSDPPWHVRLREP